MSYGHVLLSIIPEIRPLCDSRGPGAAETDSQSRRRERGEREGEREREREREREGRRDE